MRVVVDLEACQGNAICMGVAPEVFEIREDGFLYVLNDHPPSSQREAVEEAAMACPTQAITIKPG
jgi:ferredoxin